jgi:hypothetical protein
MEVSGQLYVPATLPTRKDPLVPSGSEAGWAYSLSGHGGEEKNSQPLPGFQPPIIQPVAQRCTTELPRLQWGVL